MVFAKTLQGNKDVRIFGCCNCYAGNAVALLLLLLLSITYCINNGCCCFWFWSRNEKFSIWRPIRLFAWRLFILYKFVCMYVYLLHLNANIIYFLCCWPAKGCLDLDNDRTVVRLCFFFCTTLHFLFSFPSL